MAGCSSINNLTPSQQTRNASGLYPFEVEWLSRQQALRRETIKAYVVVGFDEYPMQRTVLLSNRWETLVPVPVDKRHLTYRYKFDYDVKGMPNPQADSRFSPPFQLTLLDPPAEAVGTAK